MHCMQELLSYDRVTKISKVYGCKQKRQDPGDVINYRPISILAGFSKIFESFICPLIARHMNYSYSHNQYGFTSGHSVQSNLIPFTNNVSQGP